MDLSSIPRRPMASVRRVGIFARRIVISISQAGLEALLSGASIINEGELLENNRYFGSTMITLDLGKLSGQVYESCDVRTAGRIAELINEDKKVRRRFEEVATQEAERTAGCPLVEIITDLRVRAEGSWVFVDVDFEARKELRKISVR